MRQPRRQRKWIIAILTGETVSAYGLFYTKEEATSYGKEHLSQFIHWQVVKITEI